MKVETISDPGRLRHRLNLERQIDVPDGYGGYNSTWQLVSPLWAAIDTLSNIQKTAADTLATANLYKITIRWRPDCLPQMRFVKSGREFAINTVSDPDERLRFLICICEEIK